MKSTNCIQYTLFILFFIIIVEYQPSAANVTPFVRSRYSLRRKVHIANETLTTNATTPTTPASSSFSSAVNESLSITTNLPIQIAHSTQVLSRNEITSTESGAHRSNTIEQTARVNHMQHLNRHSTSTSSPNQNVSNISTEYDYYDNK